MNTIFLKILTNILTQVSNVKSIIYRESKNDKLSDSERLLLTELLKEVFSLSNKISKLMDE